MTHASAIPSALLRHAAAVYRKTRVNTAGERLLLVEMYDAAIACVLSPAPNNEAGHPLMRAHALISELQASLRPEHDEALARALDSFYDAILQRIVDAYLCDTPEPLVSVAAALRELRAAWSQVCGSAGQASDNGLW